MSWAYQPLLPSAPLGTPSNSAPGTPTISSPSDKAILSDTTPDIVFSSTDSDSDDIRYEVQIDTVDTFDSQGGVSTVDSYSQTNVDAYIGSDGNPSAVGQSFTGNGTALATAQFYLRKSSGSSPTGNVYAKVYAHTGTFGTSSQPTGSALATSDAVDATTLPATGSPSMVTFTFSGANQITLTNGTNYVVTFEYPDGTNFPSVLSVDVGYDSSSPTHGGNYYDDSVLITALYDLAFNVTGGSAATPLIDAVSGTDSGFSGTPDNTDPFTSGQSVTYTVQSPLTPGNYYVRVRAKDPSGTNTWSSWSATTSFNVAVPTTISVYSVTEYYDGDGSSTGNMSLTLPATIPSGSLGIYVFNQNTSAATVTSAPAGATLIDLDTSSANTDRTWAYWEPLGTSDQSASRAFNFSSSGRHTAQLYLLTGADTSTPIEDYATANATAVSSYANNNLTATADGQMRLSFWSTSLAGPTVITPTYPLGYNAGATTHGAWASAANLGIHSAYKAILTGTSGGDTATFDNTTVSFVMFDILIKASSGTTGQVKVWNGSAWVAKPVKVWNGSSWVTKPLKRWNGSAWVATTY